MNKVKSQLTASAVSKLLQEKYEWQPSASSGIAESSKPVELNEVQVNLLSNFNDMGRVTDTLRDSVLNSFLNNGASNSLISDSFSILSMSLVDLFESMCPFLGIESGNTLNIKVVSEEKSCTGTGKESSNFLETFMKSKVNADHVKKYRWKKRALKSETSKQPLTDHSTNSESKKAKLDGSDDIVENQDKITAGSQAEIPDVDDDHIFPVKSAHVDMLEDYQFYHQVTGNGACLRRTIG